MSRLIVFDCDSTLSAIEGVDELGALRGPEVKAAVEDLTNQAMAGEIPIAEVFPRRMELIRPSAAECAAIGKRYIEEIEPTALATLSALRAAGWEIVILSGGFVPVIEPLAQLLGVDRVEAVPLFFDENGVYTGFDADYPTTRNGGKPEIVVKLKAEYGAEKVVMVGDGVSDLETRSVVDLFVGFGRYAERKRVKAEAEVFIYALKELLAVFKARFAE